MEQGVHEVTEIGMLGPNPTDELFGALELVLDRELESRFLRARLRLDLHLDLVLDSLTVRRIGVRLGLAFPAGAGLLLLSLRGILPFFLLFDLLHSHPLFGAQPVSATALLVEMFWCRSLSGRAGHDERPRKRGEERESDSSDAEIAGEDTNDVSHLFARRRKEELLDEGRLLVEDSRSGRGVGGISDLTPSHI